MRPRLRLVVALAIAMAAYGVFVRALHLLNEPRDSAFYGGIALILALLLVVPLAVRAIWRQL